MPLHSGEVLATEDRLAQTLSWVTSFPLPHDSLWVGERDFGQVVTQLHQLTGLISPTCDQYIQYLLTGANPSVLNQHMLRLQPWRCWLTTYHSLTFPTDDLHFSPKGPARSLVIHPIIFKWSREGTNPKSREWEPPLNFYHKLSSRHNVC
jgi:hypothetical protein